MSELYQKVHDHLPIFAVDFGENILLYTPGFFFKIKRIPVFDLVRLFKNPERIDDFSLRESILLILGKAQECTTKWNYQAELPFSPYCLTFHVGYECNLNFSYCYSKVEDTGNKKIVGFPELEAIKSLFNYVLKIRKNNQKQFTVVYHGSGEPTFHWKKLVNSFESISRIADEKGLKVFFYIATNGCITEDQIDWLSNNMDLIGISCDGFYSINQKQRLKGNLQYLPIDEVCRRILNKGGKFDIRVTITPDSLAKLNEITTYLIKVCKARNIRIEPVYLAGSKGFQEKDSDLFIRQFIESSKIAVQFGVGFHYSGMRLFELHGPYCDVMRNTLRLTADGFTRNCFCFMTEREKFITGRYSNTTAEIVLNPKINELKKSGFNYPKECSKCINVFHCSRGCPDFCIYKDEISHNQKLNPFRCRLHQLVAVEEIKASAMNINNLF